MTFMHKDWPLNEEREVYILTFIQGMRGLTLGFPLVGICFRESKLVTHLYSKQRTAAYLCNAKKCKNMVTG